MGFQTDESSGNMTAEKKAFHPSLSVSIPPSVVPSGTTRKNIGVPNVNPKNRLGRFVSKTLIEPTVRLLV